MISKSSIILFFISINYFQFTFANEHLGYCSTGYTGTIVYFDWSNCVQKKDNWNAKAVQIKNGAKTSHDGQDFPYSSKGQKAICLPTIDHWNGELFINDGIHDENTQQTVWLKTSLENHNQTAWIQSGTDPRAGPVKQKEIVATISSVRFGSRYSKPFISNLSEPNAKINSTEYTNLYINYCREPEQEPQQ